MVEKGERETMTKKNGLLLLLAVLLAVIPLILHPGSDFSGADDKIKTVILADRPDYQPWFTALWQPPSDQVESLLFALQAALGAGVIGYVAGYYRGRRAGGKQ